ncbi:calmodulin-binding protein 60 C-like [Henckelia pumila]|uniref:calmodulin-binding protein 60 C-like n=1 Tax=Henckelia pumila TaxID=405737 RepID=UPI003C6E05D3
MERNNSMRGGRRGKRSLRDSGGDDEEQNPNRKKSALSSVTVRSFEVGSLQELCSYLEPIIQRVVRQEIERARIGGRSSPKRIQGGDERNLQLHFKSRISLPLFTGGKLEGEQGALINVELIDRNIGCVVATGPESCAKLELVTLQGDFDDDDDWSREEFESHVVKVREGKGPLLAGDLKLTLKEGVGTLGNLKFTDNSSWTRSKQFRLGLKVSSSSSSGIRVREAKTEAFPVKDHRGELYKKHYPPALNDEVWRLEKIGKDGPFHKRLNDEGISTVEDLLRLLAKDRQKLRDVLGSGMSNKMWEALVEHARSFALNGKLFVYHPDDATSVGVVFNSIFEVRALKTEDGYYPAESLSGSHNKALVETWVKKAYDNWNQIVEYDGDSSMEQQINQYYSSTPQNYNIPQGSLVPVLSQPLVEDPSMLIGGSGYTSTDLVSASWSSQLNQPLINFSYQRQCSAPDPQPYSFQADINPLEENDINDFFSEDALFSLDDIINVDEGASTSFSYREDSGIGRAIVGWLKIKAAMRWGIFIRNQAAQRRARIVELELDHE